MDVSNEFSQDLINEFVGVAHGDFQRLKAMLAAHPSLLDARASWNETAIEAATQTGQVEIVNFLLEAGAPLDIFTAIMLGRKDLVEMKLQVDPNLANAFGVHGIPILYFAAIRGHLDIAERLLELGADVNAGEGGTSALHGAVIFNQKDMVAWLLTKEARKDLRNYQEKTALDLAVELGKGELITLLQVQ